MGHGLLRLVSRLGLAAGGWLCVCSIIIIILKINDCCCGVQNIGGTNEEQQRRLNSRALVIQQYEPQQRPLQCFFFNFGLLPVALGSSKRESC
jgi:hypothetical protein